MLAPVLAQEHRAHSTCTRAGHGFVAGAQCPGTDAGTGAAHGFFKGGSMPTMVGTWALCARILMPAHVPCMGEKPVLARVPAHVLSTCAEHVLVPAAVTRVLT